jgi:hypothetical protein
MQNHKFIRFVVASYPYLQGLTVVPLGLCLMVVAIWANSLHRHAEPLEVIFISAISNGLLLTSWLSSRYYVRTFGKTLLSQQGKRFEIISILLGVPLALGAFWLDVNRKLPFSAVGLIFALAMLSIYIWVTWPVKGRYLLYYPVVAMLIVLVSILPWLGLPSWWEVFGFHSQLISVVTVTGLLFIIMGVWSHIFLMRVLPPVKEAEHV